MNNQDLISLHANLMAITIKLDALKSALTEEQLSKYNSTYQKHYLDIRSQVESGRDYEQLQQVIDILDNLR